MDLKQKYLKKAHNLAKKRKTEQSITHVIQPVSWTPLTSTPINYITRIPATPNDSHYHSQVNMELKRLLLASVGNDLQEQIEILIREKSQLKHTLNVSLNHLHECSEEMDQLTVECDIWHSQVLASRVLIDELTAYKRQHLMDHHNSHIAIETLLREREQLTACVKICHQLIMCVGRVLGQSCEVDLSGQYEGLKVATVCPVQLQPSSEGCTVIDIIMNMSVAIRIISDKINEIKKATPTLISDTPIHTVSTQGEEMALKVLQDTPPHPPPPSLIRIPHLSYSERHLLQQRKKPHPLIEPNDYSTLRYNYCCKCNGRIIIV